MFCLQLRWNLLDHIVRWIYLKLFHSAGRRLVEPLLAEFEVEPWTVAVAGPPGPAGAAQPELAPKK